MFRIDSRLLNFPNLWYNVGMVKLPFIVVCTSCESILEVRNAELVGQIVSCPKCGSMVLIEPTGQSRKRKRSSSIRLQTSDIREREDQVSEEPVSSGFSDTDIPPEDQSSMSDDSSEFEDQWDDQLDPVVAQLWEAFLPDGFRDEWKKRRLKVVAVGTICLLIFFLAFLLFVLRSSRDKPESGNSLPATMTEPPPVSDGIGVTRTGGQTEIGGNEVAVAPIEPQTPESETTGEVAGIGVQSSEEDDSGVSSAEVSNTFSEVQSPKLDVRPGVRVSGTLTDDPFDDILGTDVMPSEIGKTGPDGTDVNPVNPTRSVNEINDPGGFAGLMETVTPENSPQIAGLENSIPNEKQPIEGIPNAVPEVRSQESVVRSLDERLAVAVTSIRFEKAPIIDVVRALSDISGVPMQLDIDELRARGISIEAPISLDKNSTTIAGIIDSMLEKTRLTRHDENAGLVFGYSDEQVTALRTMRYDMTKLATLARDAISAEQTASWLTELLINQQPALLRSQLVEPQNAQTVNASVTASVNVDGNVVVVVGTIGMQDQARRLLFSLYYLRGLEPDNVMPPERLAPEVFGWDRVNAPLSFNLVESLPMKQAVRLIESHTKLRIVIDHLALHDEGFSQESSVTSRVSHGTIDTVLRGMLEPLGLTYRIVEANTVEITTP
ncbi:MAG: hypothetical protein FWD31_09175, partial [Planctomycetaceae bacterium]|nr:hypothetical protein [Planctomycetaceae bacterium]